MDDFELELKMGFLEESSQLLGDAEQCFLDLEGNPEDPKILDKIFRLAHNLKGSAKAVGFDDLGAFTHELETYLLKLKNKELSVDSSAVSLLLRCNDHVTMMVDRLKQDPHARFDSVELLADIALQIQGGNHTSEESPVADQAVVTGSTSPDFPQAEEIPSPEFIQAPAAAPPPASAFGSDPSPAAHAGSAPPPTVTVPVTDESIRVSLSRLEKLLNYVGEMVILQTVLKEQTQGEIPELLKKAVSQLGKVTKEVQDISMSLRMIPLKQTFQKMQRIVRDTSSQLNKKIHLDLEGEDTEVDKTVLEKLGDPLVHLIRNAVDHGVEDTEARVAAGKPETGRVVLRAKHQSGSLIIEVQDDGKGLDAVKLTNKAIEKGILKPGTSLSPSAAYALIFHPGFSTKTEITNVSGRGVGMDVVKSNIERLQGEIEILTELGKGTTFRIRLPLTLAIIDGMIIQCERDRFIIPLNHVQESVRLSPSDIHRKTDLGEMLLLRGHPVPLFRLTQLMNRKGSTNIDAATDRPMIAVVIHTTQDPIAIMVDDILGQHQVVVKQLGMEHRDLKGFSGSAILGDGRPALILELSELANKSRRITPSSDSRKAVA